MREVSPESVWSAVPDMRTALILGLAFTALDGNSANAAAFSGQSLKPVKQQQCDDDSDITFALRGPSTAEVGVANHFKLSVKKCDQNSGEKVKVVIDRPYVEERKVVFDDKKHAATFGIVPPSNFDKVIASNDNRITARAYDEAGVRVGAAKWIISYKRRDFNKVPPWVSRPADPRCTPNPDFKVSFQDDPQTIFQKDMPREQVFNMAAELYGATAVRFNIIYSQYKRYGIQPYNDAIDTAVRMGFDPQVVLMQDPDYFSHFGSSFSYKHLDLGTAKQFTREIVTHFGSRVNRYSYLNEMNRSMFLDPGLQKVYIHQYNEIKNEIKQINPNAILLAGELAPLKVGQWVKRFNRAKVDAISIHPYGDEMGNVCERVIASKSPVYATEYGNLHTSPFQGYINRMAIERARLSGLAQFTMYQMVSDPLAVWNTSPNGS